MKILLCNDDGIHSKGIQALKSQLENIAEVTVIAPDRERSTISHAMTLYKPLHIKEFHVNGKRFGYSVNGTPADCVIIGLLEIMKEKKPDIIVSGINRGANLGNDIVYSGTVAAAREGAMRNVPSFAISIDGNENFQFNDAARFSKEVIVKIMKHDIPKNLLLNINFPNIEYEHINGIEITRQGKRKYRDEMQKINKPGELVHYQIGGEIEKKSIEPMTDSGVVNDLKVAITPILLDITDYSMMEKMSKWVIN